MGMTDREWLVSKRNPERLTAGSIIKIHRVVSPTDERPIVYVGTVMAIRRRSIATSIDIINKIEGEMLEFGFPLFSPLITKIEVLKRGFKEKERIYYLRDPKTCPTVSMYATYKDYNQRPKRENK